MMSDEPIDVENNEIPEPEERILRITLDRHEWGFIQSLTENEGDGTLEETASYMISKHISDFMDSQDAEDKAAE